MIVLQSKSFKNSLWSQPARLTSHTLPRCKTILLSTESPRMTALKDVKHCCSWQHSIKSEPFNHAYLALDFVSRLI